MIYNDKAEKLRRRLLKYKTSHLAFIKDFEVSFDNNLSEKKLTIIKTSIKRNLNPFNLSLSLIMKFYSIINAQI